MTTQDELDVPGPVSSLSARPTSAFSILVTWGEPEYAGEGVNSYKLYYREVRWWEREGREGRM